MKSVYRHRHTRYQAFARSDSAAPRAGAKTASHRHQSELAIVIRLIKLFISSIRCLYHRFCHARRAPAAPSRLPARITMHGDQQERCPLPPMYGLAWLPHPTCGHHLHCCQQHVTECRCPFPKAGRGPGGYHLGACVVAPHPPTPNSKMQCLRMGSLGSIECAWLSILWAVTLWLHSACIQQ